MTDEREGFRWVLLLDGSRRAREVAWEAIGEPAPGEHLWVHVDRTAPEVRAWLEERAGLPPGVAAILVTDETRPRVLREGDGLFVVLRAVNLNPGATPDDMIAIRLWVEARRTISLRHRQLSATHDVLASLREGRGPANGSELLERLVERVVDGVDDALENLGEQVDDLEEGVTTRSGARPRRVLAELRRQIVHMHRHLLPQRQALAKLVQEGVPWLEESQRSSLRELTERSTRLVEELDALRERGNLISDELGHQMSEALGKRMYLISVAAALFLPLSLLAGLMGANVGGIPGASNPWGFWALSALVVTLALLGFALIRTIGWVRGPAGEEDEDGDEATL